ncbi:MAG TPA: ABC transporter permease [Gemmatimonadaceae bacterium]|nr:ABC transporter permease [Gemmatimonadaceae bacterium]
MSDLTYALRSLRRTPGFTAAAVLCLALGIGATSTVFGIVDALFFRPPPGVGDPGGIVRPYINERAKYVMMNNAPTVSYITYQTWRDGLKSLSGLAAFSALNLSAGLGTAARRVDGFLVTGSYFSVLRVQPTLGRFFAAEDDKGPGSAPTAVISHAYWQRAYGGDRAVVGKQITLDGHEYTIIGVAPTDFHGVDAANADVWIPISLAKLVGYPSMYLTSNNALWLQTVGRLAPGVSRETARAEMESMYRHLAQTRDTMETRNPHLTLGPILAARGPSTSDSARIARWLALAAALVLAIACANTANLLLARATVRRKEIAVRLSLGASGARLTRQLLVESIVLALLGAAAGLALAFWGSDLVPAIGLPPLSFFAQGRVLVFTSAAAIACGLLFGLAPAWAATRADVAGALKEGAREGIDRRSRLRTSLMIVQIALAVVLLTGAGMFVHSLRNTESVNLGMDTQHLLAVSVDLSVIGYKDSASARFDELARQRLDALPGIRSASLAGAVPVTGMLMINDFRVPDAATPTHSMSDATDLMSAMNGPDAALTWNSGADYFTTIGTPILAGRDFGAADVESNAHVVIVNQAFATRMWPGKTALGHCVDMQDQNSKWVCYSVVGVVANAKYANIVETQRQSFWTPITASMGSMNILVRTAGDPAAAVTNVRRALASLAPGLPYIEVKPYTEILRPQLQPRLLGASMFSVFGLLALVLAAIGLYGLMSYLVGQRTRELGLRMALGAQRRNVLTMVLRRALVMTLGGLAIGLVGALASARLITHLLYQVGAADPSSIVAVVVVLVATAIVAAWIPAYRASRVDPMVALRAE